MPREKKPAKKSKSSGPQRQWLPVRNPPKKATAKKKTGTPQERVKALEKEVEELKFYQKVHDIQLDSIGDVERIQHRVDHLFRIVQCIMEKYGITKEIDKAQSDLLRKGWKGSR